IKTMAVGTSHLEIVIHDTGRGIPEEHLDHIFEPFFTTRPGGSGLGLTVADRIVRDHTGMIEVISPPGAGTTFIIRLPQYQPDPLVTRIPEAHL
ncbi:MAG: histidine kinase, partial [candidate division Zixibacteria bacterium]|nr:histidine kinase [candidate division Zixibacteria bacterium]